MYTEKENGKALGLYDKTKSIAVVIRRLGYPSRQAMYCYVAFVLLFFPHNMVAVLCYVIETAGVALAVFGYVFANNVPSSLAETGNLVVRGSDFSD